MSIRDLLAASIVTICAMAGAVGAQPTTSESVESLKQRIFARFVAGDYAEAARLVERYLQDHPRDPDMLYNAACAYSRLGQRDKAAEYLFQALEAGFREFDRMKADADLEAIRDHETYQAILEALDQIEAGRKEREAAAPRKAAPAGESRPATRHSRPQPAGSSSPDESALDQWRRQYGEGHYRYERDQVHHLAFATALDEVSHAEMRRMIQHQCDQLVKTLFEAPPDQEVLIAIPTPQDADKLFPNQRVGGNYVHGLRRLISRNIGGNLRHELVHVHHHAHMDRIRQTHPLWVQEGLASLYEDYELDNGGAIRFLSNERHNIVKRLAVAHRLTKWSVLIQISDERFMDEAQTLYPQARSIFLFIAAKGKLGAWYRSFVERFEQDSTGRAATEAVFGASLTEIERQWKAWLTTQPALDLRVGSGDASLGVEIALDAANDGVVVKEVLMGSAAEEAGIQRGDIIVAIDGRATRSTAELLSIVGSGRVGDALVVRLRRRDAYHAVTITLRPM